MDGILMIFGDIVWEYVMIVGYFFFVFLFFVKWILFLGWFVYEYINNGNVMIWKVMFNLIVFVFCMILLRGKYCFYIYNILVEYIFILSKIFWLI